MVDTNIACGGSWVSSATLRGRKKGMDLVELVCKSLGQQPKWRRFRARLGARVSVMLPQAAELPCTCKRTDRVTPSEGGADRDENRVMTVYEDGTIRHYRCGQAVAKGVDFSPSASPGRWFGFNPSDPFDCRQ